MRVLVTGATGFVGSAIVQDLLRRGHQVLGLARTEEGARSLTAVGAEVHRGNLDDLESLRSGAAAADGVIHAAFNHDFSRFAENAEADRRAIEAIGDVLAGSDRPLIITAGLPVTPGRVSTENDMPPATGGSPRVSEQTAIALAARGVRASVVRMSQVHDRDRQGFATYLIAHAREKGVSAYVGDAINRWPAVHRLDAAALYGHVLEKGIAGAKYHAVGEKAVSVREIAEAIGAGLRIPVLALPPEEAANHFGWLAMAANMDHPASSALTQQALGWRPVQTAGFLSDLQHSTAFET